MHLTSRGLLHYLTDGYSRPISVHLSGLSARGGQVHIDWLHHQPAQALTQLFWEGAHGLAQSPQLPQPTQNLLCVCVRVCTCSHCVRPEVDIRSLPQFPPYFFETVSLNLDFANLVKLVVPQRLCPAKLGITDELFYLVFTLVLGSQTQVLVLIH